MKSLVTYHIVKASLTSSLSFPNKSEQLKENIVSK